MRPLMAMNTMKNGVKTARAWFTARTARRITREHIPEPGPVVVAGLLGSVVGIGEGARLAYRELERMDWGPAGYDLSATFPCHAPLDFPIDRHAPANGPGSMLLHLNPPELPRAITALGRSQLGRRKIIGYWAWELPEFPDSWTNAARYLDALWVPSAFVARAASRANLEAKVVPHPVVKPTPSNCARVDFGIPEHATAFLVMFDMLSSISRKNPLGAVRAFRHAFAGRDDVALILKLTHPSVESPGLSELMAAIGSARNISVMDRPLPSDDLAALVNCCDALVSLHRAEGFGLALAEAMHLGRVVIATGWSGNLDFMDEANSLLVKHTMVPVRDSDGVYNAPDQLWAEPDLLDAGEKMHAVANDSSAKRLLGVRAQQSIEVLRKRFGQVVNEVLGPHVVRP